MFAANYLFIMINQISKNLAEVFKDVDAHQNIAGIMVSHATNSMDIRGFALDGIDFSGAIKILDIGCGFGFFTRALRGRTNSGATITGVDCHQQYRDAYLNSCNQAEINGKFIGECISSIQRIKSNTIDVILCSYALYFFPEILPQVSRILKDDGVFVAITHSENHLQEIGSHVKKVFSSNEIKFLEVLPYKALADKFSGENGRKILTPWFGRIQAKAYKNSLIFSKADFSDLEAYLRFKQSFFIPDKQPDAAKLIAMLLDLFKHDLIKTGKVEISKNDNIFTCTKPLMKGRA